MTETTLTLEDIMTELEGARVTISDLQTAIEDIVQILNLFVLPERFLFTKNVSIMANKSFGTDKGSKIGFFGTTPVVQPSTQGTVDQSIVGGATVHAGDTFGNGAGGNYYTISDIVKALEATGILK